jgi:transketolase
MAIIDSAGGKTLTKYSIDELKEQAALMRGYSLTALCAAGSGHAGGTLSIMDVAAALYLRCADHDPKNPDWKMRDRIIWSAGHKAPALYTGLAFSGYFDKKDMMTLRKLGSPFQGHPHRMKLPGVEVSTGSLGQGLSLAVGVALAQKMDRVPAKTFCIMGDGEQQEGQIWEAAMEAAHYKLDNLIGIIDQNQLQIDGPVADVMNIDPLDEKYRSFGWHVLRVNGHDMEEIVETLECVKNEPAGRPTMLICYTIKGKGVSFMENQPGWHGRAPNIQELEKSAG